MQLMFLQLGGTAYMSFVYDTEPEADRADASSFGFLAAGCDPFSDR